MLGFTIGITRFSTIANKAERDVYSALCSPYFAPRSTSENEPSHELLTRLERLAGQVVDRRVGAALGERGWWWWGSDRETYKST